MRESPPGKPTWNATGFKRIRRALICSLAGYRSAWRGEEAFRQEVVITIVLTPVAALVAESAIETVLLIGSLLLILIIELLNTAVEYSVDRVGTEWHDFSKKAKDIASAAVLTALANAALVWCLILLL